MVELRRLVVLPLDDLQVITREFPARDLTAAGAATAWPTCVRCWPNLPAGVL